MEPDNHWVVEENSLPKVHFWGSMLIFPGVDCGVLWSPCVFWGCLGASLDLRVVERTQCAVPSNVPVVCVSTRLVDKKSPTDTSSPWFYIGCVNTSMRGLGTNGNRQRVQIHPTRPNLAQAPALGLAQAWPFLLKFAQAQSVCPPPSAQPTCSPRLPHAACAQST